MTIEVKFLNSIATVTYLKDGHWIRRATMQTGAKALKWMAKQGLKWTWGEDEDGNEFAIWTNETEEA